jgi:hypothetical protein
MNTFSQLRILNFNVHYSLMWGIGIYLIHLVGSILGRRNKMHCTQCGRIFKDDRELDIHIRTDHRYSI